MRSILPLFVVLAAGCNLFAETDEPDRVLPDVGADTGDSVDVGVRDADMVDTGTDVSTDVGPDASASFAPLPTGIVGYSFEEVVSGTFPDVSSAPTYDLQIAGMVSKTPGGVFISADGALETDEPPVEWIDAVMASGEFAIAMWVATDAVSQGGPGEAQNFRIVTNSIDSASRNVHIAQYEDDVLLRLRTSGSDMNGSPNIILPDVFVDAEKHFHVFQSADGFIEYYVDGQLVLRQTITGDLTGWDQSHRLRVGNEFDMASRPWAGTMYDLQFYDRNFTADEIAEAFMAGEPGR